MTAAATPTSNTPKMEHDEPTYPGSPPYRLGRDHAFVPLQDSEPMFSRSHLNNLLLQTAQNQSSDNVNTSQQKALQSTIANPHLRYLRLIGDNNPRYQWDQYRKTDEELEKMKKPIQEYYERNNSLIARYEYIDRLLDSTLPRDLLQTYHDSDDESVASEYRHHSVYTDNYGSTDSLHQHIRATKPVAQRKRPSYLYKIADEESPLLDDGSDHGGGGTSEESQAQIVKIAIGVNFGANAVLLVAKLMVALLTNSLSVLASLVDGILDFLSTVIVVITAWLISRKDTHSYPIGRARLEPLGVLVFAIIMIVSFVQVGLHSAQSLWGTNREVINLSPTAIIIMASTVVVKGACYFWCRLIRNSSVQALAEDALTDVIFNFFSILFPLAGVFTNTWWLDPLGGLILSIYVIVQWSKIAVGHIKNLTGASASADQRNVLLYTTMRFARSIKQITSVHAYHAGDKLNVEVDIVLEQGLELKDSHDLGESLQYTLESLPIVDRAFVHLDYDSRNPPGHLR
ncbi:cation diffusion facilitator 10 [Pyronema domesticum]|uniref:Similar to Metal tolerance protein 5 acc. no. Q5NA18 n=1 Tax=Pyronema omphalodes (strain CBS 100304) TaxID=1076935 RepID=U4LPK2_PYROM|nr:cation diffusion facilitator 10 [Pyronema domesticum]CCX34096.1 Similar to Metal tolerance protein 5; acc. no. Q5NA18 [Pyronema omphalodes CBS 100304]